MSHPVRLGTVGYGIMGERLLRVARAHDPQELVSVGAWDPSAAAMARYRADFPDGHAFASLEALLAASDVVHVASPPAFHLDQLEQAVAAGCAVHCTVVHLQQQGEAPGRDALDIVEPFDNIDLPHGLVPAQRRGVDARGENAQLPPVAGFGQGDVAHVVLEVKIRVFHPVGSAEAVGNKSQFATENRRQMQAVFQQGENLLEAHLAARGS